MKFLLFVVLRVFVRLLLWVLSWFFPSIRTFRRDPRAFVVSMMNDQSQRQKASRYLRYLYDSGRSIGSRVVRHVSGAFARIRTRRTPPKSDSP